jgi:hypothetical protein
MANTINFIACGIITFLLLISIALAGPHLLLPAIAMIVTILIGGVCIYVANGLLESRDVIEKEWEANNPE